MTGRRLGANGEFEAVDPRFRHFIQSNAWVERLYDGCRWAEGPVYFADGDYLLWSDIPNDRILQWADGLGVPVVRALNTVNTALGFESGFIIVVVAILLDRMLKVTRT